jgi:DNA-binding MarR family transcriptional regulator
LRDERKSTVLDKCELLNFLDSHENAEANDVAETFDLTYSATAMALLRLVRQDLAARHTDPDSQLLVYEITPKGEGRLDYFLEREFDDD